MDNQRPGCLPSSASLGSVLYVYSPSQPLRVLEAHVSSTATPSVLAFMMEASADLQDWEPLPTLALPLPGHPCI